jgi:RNA-directed DNA polymerase
VEKARDRRGPRLARSCDACLLVVTSRRAGDRLKATLTRVLQRPRKLEITATKSTLGATTACTCLGFTFPGARL